MGDGSPVETETKWGDATLSGDEGRGCRWSQVSVGGCSGATTGAPAPKGAGHEGGGGGPMEGAEAAGRELGSEEGEVMDHIPGDAE